MVQHNANDPHKRQSPGDLEAITPLNYQGVYLCPICRHGQLSGLPLMEAFACNFCRHIFTADLEKQWLQVVDGSQPLTWRWNGRQWIATYRDRDLELTWEIWLVGIALVILPPALVGLAYHTFPPDASSAGSWFPPVWIGVTFACHLTMVCWLIVEHYQFPIYVSLQVRWRQLWGR